MFRISTLLIYCLLAGCILSGQDFSVPGPDALRTKADYPRYQETFLKSVDWLLEQDLDAEGRASVNAFVLAWISGTDAFHIELKSYVMNLTKRNPDLLMIFLGSWAKRELEGSAPQADLFLANYKALEALLGFYQKSQAKQKDPNIERLLKRRARGRLSNWLRQKI